MNHIGEKYLLPQTHFADAVSKLPANDNKDFSNVTRAEIELLIGDSDPLVLEEVDTYISLAIRTVKRMIGTFTRDHKRHRLNEAIWIVRDSVRRLEELRPKIVSVDKDYIYMLDHPVLCTIKQVSKEIFDTSDDLFTLSVKACLDDLF